MYEEGKTISMAKLYKKSQRLVKDINILVGGNSITNCNTRSTNVIVLPMDMGQLDVVVGVEGDVEVLLGLGPLLVGGVSCPLQTENSPKLKRVLTCKNIFSYTLYCKCAYNIST